MVAVLGNLGLRDELEEQPGETTSSDGRDLPEGEMASYLDHTVARQGAGLHELANDVGVVLDLSTDRVGPEARKFMRVRRIKHDLETNIHLRGCSGWVLAAQKVASKNEPLVLHQAARPASSWPAPVADARIFAYSALCVRSGSDHGTRSHLQAMRAGRSAMSAKITSAW